MDGPKHRVKVEICEKEFIKVSGGTMRVIIGEGDAGTSSRSRWAVATSPTSSPGGLHLRCLRRRGIPAL